MDLKELIDNEIPKAHSMKELLKERVKINGYKKELDDRRKSIDSEMREFCDDNDIDVLLADDIKLTVISSSSAGRWDKNKLFLILSPTQLEEVYSEGKKYKYIKVEEQ